MTDQLADVIYGAIGEYRIGSPIGVGDHIAAAVRAHMESEAVVERVARAIDPRTWGDEAGAGLPEGVLRDQFIATKRAGSLRRARAALAAAGEE